MLSWVNGSLLQFGQSLALDAISTLPVGLPLGEENRAPG